MQSFLQGDRVTYFPSDSREFSGLIVGALDLRREIEGVSE